MNPSLASIHVYPLKSAGGISPARWSVDEFGPRYDRRWMVTDENGVFLSQRGEPRLALVGTSILDGELRLSPPGMPPTSVPLEPRGLELDPVIVWKDEILAERCGAQADAWISTFLHRLAQLVRMPDTAERQVDQRYARQGEKTSFSDGFPFCSSGRQRWMT